MFGQRRLKIIASHIPYNYKTIRITQSRINKGLLAIPKSLEDSFPTQKTKVKVSTGIDNKFAFKNFTPYASKSHECRIGGMQKFYKECGIKNGDEIVIQILGDDEYRILLEKDFVATIQILEKEFDDSKNENDAIFNLKKVSDISGEEVEKIAFYEYCRLSLQPIKKRAYKVSANPKKKENVKASLRQLLTLIYKGKCQLTGFSFKKRDRNPFFEIHHIKSGIGDHLKNLLVVSPNIHAQFTYANVRQIFDGDGWLRTVRFDKDEFNVNHIIDSLPIRFHKEVHFDS